MANATEVTPQSMEGTMTPRKWSATETHGWTFDSRVTGRRQCAIAPARNGAITEEPVLIVGGLEGPHAMSAGLRHDHNPGVPCFGCTSPVKPWPGAVRW